VIQPVVATVVQRFEGQSIGVIGTRATIESGWYQRLLEERGCRVKAKSTPLLASAIEEGFHAGKVSSALIEAYLTEGTFDGIKALVLGCTHYPLISQEISSLLPEGVEVIDSADSVARALSEASDDFAMGESDSQNPGRRRFIVSDLTRSFQLGAERFFGSPVVLEERKLGGQA
jgi:glutamate racemase